MQVQTGTDKARRGLMAGTIATAALAPLPTFGGGGGGNDTELLALGRAFDAAVAAYERFDREVMKPAYRELDARAAAPVELQINGDPGSWWRTWEIEAALAGDGPQAVREGLHHLSREALERRLSLSEETIERYRAASEELRIDELDEEFGDLHGAAMDIVRQIADFTPQTPGGLVVSIRALRYPAPEFWGDDFAEWTDEFAGMVIDAAAALAARAA
jgi:hypothetical protein